MMAVPYENYDLGRVLQTAESIKNMRRNAEADKLQQAYMGQRMQNDQEDRAQAQTDRESAQKVEQAKHVYLVSQAVLGSEDPVSTVRQFAPDLIQEIDSHYGPGSFDRLAQDPVKLKAIIGQTGQMAGAHAGIQPEQETFGQPQNIVKDGKPMVVQIGNRGTVRPVQGAAPYNRPDKGIKVKGPDGTEISIGGDGQTDYPGVELGKATRTNLEAAFNNAQGNAYALREQLAKYKPEFSTIGGRVKAGIANVKEQVGMENAPQQQQFLSDFTSWKADTANLLSQYLNQLSGAAISPTEEARLKAGFPNADDGPTQYQAKAKETMRKFSLVQARSAYLLSTGNLKLDSVSLDNMSGIIAGEANKLAESLKRGGMQAEEANAQAIAQTRARFGLDSQNGR